MRIALGAYLLSGTPGYRQAGIHRYIKSLLAEFDQRAEATMDAPAFTALISPTAARELQPRSIDVRLASRSTESPLARIRIEQFETPRALRATGAALYHGMAFVVPLRAPCKTVVTVHDLSFITQPSTHKRANRAYLSLFTRWSCRRATRVIAVSEWTKRDVVAMLGVRADNVDVVPHGVPARFTRASDDAIAAFKRQRRIGPNSIFFLGSLEPRKNLTALIEALAQLPDTDAELIVGGGEGWRYQPIYARVEALGLRDRVRFIGHVSDDEAPLWLSACDVFAYPSLYEGFGMPVVEAMACGAVVVSSDATALPEVVGDAGLMAPPSDAGALASQLHRALSDAGLRATLRQRALERAAGYTWRRTAELTLQSYRRALGGA